MKLADLLKRDAETSVALAAAVERAEQAGAAAQAQVEALDRQRSEALLADADDKTLDRIEGEQANARRDVDRSRLALLDLRRRLALVQQTEEQARRDAIHARGQKAQARYHAVVHGAYAKGVAAVLAAVAELDALTAEVQAVNLELGAIGDERRLTDPDEAARPHGPGLRVMHISVSQGLRLPDPTDGGRLAYPSRSTADPSVPAVLDARAA